MFDNSKIGLFIIFNDCSNVILVHSKFLMEQMRADKWISINIELIFTDT